MVVAMFITNITPDKDGIRGGILEGKTAMDLMLPNPSYPSLTQQEAEFAQDDSYFWQSYVQDKQLYSTANLLAVPEGFIDWQTFGSSEIKPIRELVGGIPHIYVEPSFSEQAKSLDNKIVKIYGYVFPLKEENGMVKEFLIGALPQSCAFHYHVDPNYYLEGKIDDGKQGFEFTFEPMKMQGRLKLHQKHQFSTIYELTEVTLL